MPQKSEFVRHKSRFVHHILCESPFKSRDLVRHTTPHFTAYFGVIFSANMGGGGGRNYFHTIWVSMKMPNFPYFRANYTEVSKGNFQKSPWSWIPLLWGIHLVLPDCSAGQGFGFWKFRIAVPTVLVSGSVLEPSCILFVFPQKSMGLSLFCLCHGQCPCNKQTYGHFFHIFWVNFLNSYLHLHSLSVSEWSLRWCKFSFLAKLVLPKHALSLPKSFPNYFCPSTYHRGTLLIT